MFYYSDKTWVFDQMNITNRSLYVLYSFFFIELMEWNFCKPEFEINYSSHTNKSYARLVN